MGAGGIVGDAVKRVGVGVGVGGIVRDAAKRVGVGVGVGGIVGDAVKRVGVGVGGIVLMPLNIGSNCLSLPYHIHGYILLKKI